MAESERRKIEFICFQQLYLNVTASATTSSNKTNKEM
jgi:hypothetical protein